MENGITFITGMRPRKDDAVWTVQTTENSASESDSYTEIERESIYRSSKSSFRKANTGDE